jgi:hypothetical protein
MKAEYTTIAHVTKEIHTIISFGKNDAFEICGDIIDGTIDKASIQPALDDVEHFDILDEDLQTEIIEFAYEEFLKFC